MSDNTTYTPGLGATIAAKDIGDGVLAQRIHPVVGTQDVSSSNPVPSILTPGENHVGSIGMNSFIGFSATLTRLSDTTTYASGDIIYNLASPSTPGGTSVTVARTDQGLITIKQILISTDNATLTNASFRVHIYDRPTQPVNGDNGVFLATRSGYYGHVDVTLDVLCSDGAVGCGAPGVGNSSPGASIVIKPDVSNTNLKNIYLLLEARAAYTPASGQKFIFRVSGVQD